MNSKKIGLGVLATCALALTFSLARAQTSGSQLPQAEPRYDIIAATVDGIPDKNGHIPEERTVFLLERNSGRAWKFNNTAFAYRKDGTPTGPAMPAYFESISADGFGGFDSKLAIKEWMGKQKFDK